MKDEMERDPNKFWERFKGFILVVDSIILLLLILLMRKILKSEAMGWGAALLMVMIFLVFCFFLFIFARLISPIVSGYFAIKFTENVLYAGNLVREAPPELAQIRAMIAKGNIDDAMEELKSILLEKPRDRYAIELMSDIFIDKIQDYKNAIGLLAGYLKAPEREDGDLQFVMKLTDVYLEVKADDRAVNLLTAELDKKYSPKAIEKISKRLVGIKALAAD